MLAKHPFGHTRRLQALGGLLKGELQKVETII